jgi:hypothetical protein
MAEVTGKVTNIYPVEQISDKQKQSFTIKTEDAYPKDIAFECWAKTCEFLAKAKVGDSVTVSYDISSREYNNKWYTSAKAFKIVVNGETAAAGEPKDKFKGAPTDTDLPF